MAAGRVVNSGAGGVLPEASALGAAAGRRAETERRCPRAAKARGRALQWRAVKKKAMLALRPRCGNFCREAPRALLSGGKNRLFFWFRV